MFRFFSIGWLAPILLSTPMPSLFLLVLRPVKFRDPASSTRNCISRFVQRRRFEIHRFPELGLPQTIDLLQMARSIPPPQRHFFVLYESQQFTVNEFREKLWAR